MSFPKTPLVLALWLRSGRGEQGIVSRKYAFPPHFENLVDEGTKFDRYFLTRTGPGVEHHRKAVF